MESSNSQPSKQGVWATLIYCVYLILLFASAAQLCGLFNSLPAWLTYVNLGVIATAFIVMMIKKSLSKVSGLLMCYCFIFQVICSVGLILGSDILLWPNLLFATLTLLLLKAHRKEIFRSEIANGGITDLIYSASCIVAFVFMVSQILM